MRNLDYVAPYVGAWIETAQSITSAAPAKSHPTWVRGLKQHAMASHSEEPNVAPYVGAWIETAQSITSAAPANVAPYVGAWIETY